MSISPLSEAHDALFQRFMDRFPADPAVAQDVWAALNGQTGELRPPGGMFGVVEMSVSLQAGKATGVRWLAETLRREAFTLERAERLRAIAHQCLSLLVPEDGSDTARANFDRLFDLAYLGPTEISPQSRFRIGYAVEFMPGDTPAFRWYAEPRTAGNEQAADRMTAIAESQGLERHWAEADRKIRESLPGSTLRGYGVDFSRAAVRNLKVYYAVPACDWSALRSLAPSPSGPAAEALKRFHSLILKGRDRLPTNTLLVAAVLAPLLDPAAPIIKWDVYLPRLHTSDSEVQAAVTSLCSDLSLEDDSCRRLWETVAGPLEPDDCANLHQYASLDATPLGNVKFNLYLRSPEHVTEHTPPMLAPRCFSVPAPGDVSAAVQRGLVFLADAASDGYRELAHRMAFPAEAGFTSSESPCEGLVFQRATICKTLAQAPARFGVDRKAIEDELSYLAGAQDAPSGGWKYFPTLNELPPDADDLAQVMLALTQAHHPGATALLDRIMARATALMDATRGTIPTWLIGPEEAVYQDAIRRWWGDGMDVEVVANFAYALWRTDPEPYRDWLDAAADWLAWRQDASGWWESVWYWGRMYGTWMAARLLAVLQPDHLCLWRTSRRWLSEEGEEGMPWEASPLETALGVAVGNELWRCGLLTEGHGLWERRVHWLCARQERDGGWPAAPFIRMDLRRAERQRGGEGPPQYVSYGSRTLTTALCLQALMDHLTLTGGD